MVCELVLLWDSLLAGGTPALHGLVGVRFGNVDFFLLFEGNGQDEQQSDQSERGERDQGKHQDGHGGLLIHIVPGHDRWFGDAGHQAM